MFHNLFFLGRKKRWLAGLLMALSAPVWATTDSTTYQPAGAYKPSRFLFAHGSFSLRCGGTAATPQMCQTLALTSSVCPTGTAGTFRLAFLQGYNFGNDIRGIHAENSYLRIGSSPSTPSYYYIDFNYYLFPASPSSGAYVDVSGGADDVAVWLAYWIYCEPAP